MRTQPTPERKEIRCITEENVPSTLRQRRGACSRNARFSQNANVFCEGIDKPGQERDVKMPLQHESTRKDRDTACNEGGECTQPQKLKHFYLGMLLFCFIFDH